VEEGTLQSMGAQLVVELMKVLKTQMRTQDDADMAALILIAMKKQTQLKVVYSKLLCDKRMADFLTKDFTSDDAKAKAAKNAFRLLSLHRILLGAAFFILSGDVEAAIDTIAVRGRQPYLATLICRLYAGDHSPACRMILDILAPEEDISSPGTSSLPRSPRLSSKTSPGLDAKRGSWKRQLSAAGVTTRSQAVSREVHGACAKLWCRDMASEWASSQGLGGKAESDEKQDPGGMGQSSLCVYSAAKWHSERMYAYRR